MPTFRRTRSDHATIAAGFAGLLALITPGVAGAQRAEDTAERVVFAPGATSAVLHGTVGRETSTRDYLLRVRAGQRMRLRLRGAAETSAEVLAPDARRGAQAPWSMGAVQAGERWDARLLDAGEHRIRVSSYQRAAARYTLTVAVADDADPRAAAAPSGHYYAANGGARVELTPVAGGALRFELHAVWYGPRPFYQEGVIHLGDASGTLRPRGHVAVWRRGACRLVFRLSEERVYVQQIGSDVECGFGANVSADGAYARAPAPAATSLPVALRAAMAPRPRRSPPPGRPSRTPPGA